MTFTITGGRVLTPMRLIENGMVSIENGKIAYVGAYDSAEIRGDMIDAGGQIVSPGFIDIHTHGGGGHDFMDGTVEAFLGASALHASHGTTCLLPTSLSSSDEELIDMLHVFKEAAAKNKFGAEMPGCHLEGPFFSLAQCGAQDPKYITPPDPVRYEKILEEGKGSILRWSLAPELPGAMQFIRRLREEGIVASIGHSDATDKVAVEAIENGCHHMTHLYSGMSALVRIKSYRYPGLIESAWLFDEFTSEIIADGCHLPQSLLRHCYRTLGTNRLCLVTDSMRGAGATSGETLLGSLKAGQPCIIEDGVAKLPDRSAFAGSVATADRLVRNMKDLAGAPLTDAVKMMTMTPARIMGLKNKGILAPGYDADIVLFDDDIHISRTICGGKTIYTA